MSEEQRQAADDLWEAALWCDDGEEWQPIAAALAEAEARGRAEGRAEVAAKVEDLAEEIFNEARRAAASTDPELAHPYLNAANRLRALLTDTEGAQ
jgi:hypothetical protein